MMMAEFRNPNPNAKTLFGKVGYTRHSVVDLSVTQ